MPDRQRVSVIGGGIVDLAPAPALLEEGLRGVVVLEVEETVASHQLGRSG